MIIQNITQFVNFNYKCFNLKGHQTVITYQYQTSIQRLILAFFIFSTEIIFMHSIDYLVQILLNKFLTQMSSSPNNLQKKYSIVIFKKQPYLPKLNKNIINFKRKDDSLDTNNNFGNASFRKQVDSSLVCSLGRVKTQNNIQMDERRKNIKNKIKQRLIKQMGVYWENSPKQRIYISSQSNSENIKNNRSTDLSKKITLSQQKWVNKSPKAKLSPIKTTIKKRQNLLAKYKKQQKLGIQGKHMRYYLNSEENENQNYHLADKYSSIQSYSNVANKKNVSQLINSLNNHKVQKLQDKYQSISVLNKKNIKTYDYQNKVPEENTRIEPWNIEIQQ